MSESIGVIAMSDEVASISVTDSGSIQEALAFNWNEDDFIVSEAIRSYVAQLEDGSSDE